MEKYENEINYIDESPNVVILVRDTDGFIQEVVTEDA